MKKLLLALILVCLTVQCGHTAVVLKETKKFEEQKFETVITITYNSITLEQAQIVEAIVKRKFNDACEIDVSLKESNAIWSTAASDYATTSDYIDVDEDGLGITHFPDGSVGIIFGTDV